LPVVLPYSGYGGDGWIRVLCRVLLVKPGLDLRKPTRAIRGWRSFTSIAVAGAEVTVTANGQTFTVYADRGGVVDVDVKVALPPGLQSIELHVENAPPTEAPIYVVHPDARVGLVSDIDDTVMVTALPRPFVAAWNTFVLDEHARQPVPGMAVLYERIVRENPSCPVVYLSTGAWNVAPTLDRFLSRHLYPEGTLLLTDWGPTHDRVFRSGRDHKQESLERLSREFPSIRWILVGDDGQHDEELYRDFANAHPDNVHAVAIRQLSAGEAVLAGGRTRVEDADENASDAPWVWAPDGAGLAVELGAVGILAPNDVPRLD
jgi:phosphatidate phosphatase APP1